MKFEIVQPPFTIQIDDNDDLVVWKRRKVVWSIPCSDVTDIVSKLKGLTKLKRDVTIFTASGVRKLKDINVEEYEVFLTFFSALGSKKTSKEATRWYHSYSDPIHVHEYANLRLMEREITEASKFGWKIETVSATAGHVMGTVRVGHMSGSFRSSDRQTVIFKHQSDK